MRRRLEKIWKRVARWSFDGPEGKVIGAARGRRQRATRNAPFKGYDSLGKGLGDHEEANFLVLYSGDVSGYGRDVLPNCCGVQVRSNVGIRSNDHTGDIPLLLLFPAFLSHDVRNDGIHIVY